MDTSGLSDMAEEIVFQVGAWEDFGYTDPPAPDCKPIPPLGERSANAVRASRAAVDDIDKMIDRLQQLRAQLVRERRQDEDIRAARIDARLTRPGGPTGLMPQWTPASPDAGAQ